MKYRIVIQKTSIVTQIIESDSKIEAEYLNGDSVTLEEDVEEEEVVSCRRATSKEIKSVKADFDRMK